MRLLFSCATAVGCLTASLSAHASEPVREFIDGDKYMAPQGTKLRLGAVGLGVTGVSYGAALGASYIWSDDPGAEDLRIPVVGPWMKVGKTTLCQDIPDATESCSDVLQVVGAVFSGFIGVVQVGGLALLTEAIFLKEGSPKRVGYSGPYGSSSEVGRDAGPLVWQTGDVTMTATPVSFGESSFGLGLLGVF